MTDVEIRLAVLQKLYDIRKLESPNAGYRDEELAEVLNLEKKSLNFNMGYLKEKGFIRGLSLSATGITAKGIDLIEGPSVFYPPDQYIRQQIEINGVSGGQINLAHTINDPSLFLDQLSAEIEKRTDIDQDKKAYWKKTLLEMSKHPVLLEVAKKLFSYLSS